MSQQTLTARQARALELRREGKKLREIGDELEISAGRARMLIERALVIERSASWADGLPARYVRALLSRGIDTLAELRVSIDTGALRRMPGIGPKCYSTITEWMHGK